MSIINVAHRGTDVLLCVDTEGLHADNGQPCLTGKLHTFATMHAVVTGGGPLTWLGMLVAGTMAIENRGCDFDDFVEVLPQFMAGLVKREGLKARFAGQPVSGVFAGWSAALRRARVFNVAHGAAMAVQNFAVREIEPDNVLMHPAVSGDPLALGYADSPAAMVRLAAVQRVQLKALEPPLAAGGALLLCTVGAHGIDIQRHPAGTW